MLAWVSRQRRIWFNESLKKCQTSGQANAPQGFIECVEAAVKKNVRWFDRLGRGVLGVALIAWLIAGGPWWAAIGLLPLATGAWGYCPVYSFLRVGPSEEP